MAKPQPASVKRIAAVIALASVLLGSQRGRAATPTADSTAAGSASSASPVTYERDVLPVLTKAGCNSGACHGKARGQNGFQLSLLGFDPEFDYRAIVREGRGRRVFPSAADHSLLLRKASASVPHGGGERLDASGPWYELVRTWIAGGMPRQGPGDPRLDALTISPPEQVLASGAEQQLLVTAHYSDGSTRDVTPLCEFKSNEAAIVDVSDQGLVRAGQLPGEATIMIRYLDEIGTWNTAIPLEGVVDPQRYAELPRYNRIDELVWQKLAQLGILPSPPASDATFLRRVYLDLIGRLPTVDQSRAFLDDSDPERRAKLVDRLLERPEYGDHWANIWVDLLRPNPYRVGIKATLNFDNWIRDAFRRNQPYDQFVHDLVTAQGSTWRNGAATLFRDRREPEEIVTLVSQLFLGIRLECAKCHHHPFEAWGQDDFYELAGYFARVGRKGTGLSPPISGGEEIVFTAERGSVAHPLTGQPVQPRPLFGEIAAAAAEQDPRRALADWMTDEANPYFARVAVNRVWAELMGRGLVDPVDDLRATNPPSNEPLLAALAEEFREQHYDLKQLLRTIVRSYVYQLSSVPGERNQSDNRNYSRHYRSRLRAEVLLDAVCDISEVPESFAAMPPESRANTIWTHRVGSLFLDTFGRPDANQDPPCERTRDTTVVQALHLMNSPALAEKLSADQGRVARLAASGAQPAEIVEELYLACYCRRPTADELAATTQLFAADGSNRRAATEDLLWALLNTPEFIFKD